MHSNFKAMYARLVFEFEYIAGKQKTYMRSLTKIHRTKCKDPTPKLLGSRFWTPFFNGQDEKFKRCGK